MEGKKLSLFLSIVLICLIGNIQSIFCATFPKPVGWVNDFAGVIPCEYEDMLNVLITDLEKKTSCEIAVVTVNTVSPLDINSYAVELYEDWGIGKKDKDNGVLVLLAMNERKVRIETGYGVEGILPDGLCGEIIRYKMVPYFKKGDFGSGVSRGVIALASKIAEEYGVSLSLDDMPKAHYKVGERGGIGILGSLFALLLFLLIFGLRLGLFGFLFFPMGGGYWRSGGYSGGLGGFSGGFSGFGGGLSGGGGATGNW